MILALVYVEVFLIGEICVYCTSAHIVALAAIGLASVVLVRGKSRPESS